MFKGELTLSRARGAKAQKRMHTQENTINFNQALKTQFKQIVLVPKTRNQEHLILNLLDPNQHIVVAVGPAGTGKTYLAMQAAIKALKTGGCDRIVLTRPAVGVDDEKHGFLPGDLISKMEPWTRPLLDVLREYYRPQEIVKMMDSDESPFEIRKKIIEMQNQDPLIGSAPTQGSGQPAIDGKLQQVEDIRARRNLQQNGQR